VTSVPATADGDGVEPARRVLGWFGSVRIRITLAAAVVFAVAFTAAAFLLVDAVRSSLEADVRNAGTTAVAGVKQQLRRGLPPGLITFVPAPGLDTVQVINGDGQVIAGGLGASGQVKAPPLAPLGGDGTLSATGSGLVVRQKVGSPLGPLTIVAASSLETVRRSVDTLVGILAVGTPLLVLAVGVLVWFLVGRALRPVDAIRSEVEVISHSTLHRRVPVPRARDEVARLAGTMNDMLDRIDRATRRQRDFVSDASHELRHPVASIRASAEVALREPLATDWPAVVADVLAEDLRMQHVVDELLDLARIEENGPGNQSVDLDDVVSEEVHRINDPRVSFEASGIATGRRSDIALVVRNLLTNASRHARSSVRVSATIVDGTALVLVDDDGPGIPLEARDRVFERFTRADEARARDDGGVGLGLAIVRAVASRSGGSARVDDAPAGGARLIVRLGSHPE
jgi:signal transduction histidine kinase